MTRIEEKQAQREKDARALAEGRITQEELAERNTVVVLPNARIRWDKLKSPR